MVEYLLHHRRVLKWSKGVLIKRHSNMSASRTFQLLFLYLPCVVRAKQGRNIHVRKCRRRMVCQTRSYCLTVSLGLPEQPFVAELGSSFVGVVEMAKIYNL